MKPWFVTCDTLEHLSETDARFVIDNTVIYEYH